MNRERLKEIIAEVLGMDDAASVSDDADFYDDLGADSLDIAQIILQVEDEMGEEFDSEDLGDIHTVNDAIELLENNQSNG